MNELKERLDQLIEETKQELRNIYLPHDTVLLLSGKRLGLEIAANIIGVLPEQPVTECHDLEEEADDLEETIRNKADEMFFASGFYEDVHHDFRIDMSKEEFVAYARHFYELGKNARKEEK